MLPIRKVPLKNFKLRESLDEDDLAKHNNMLIRSSKLVMKGEQVASYSEIYRTCDLLCRYGHGRQLYSSLHNELTVLIKTEISGHWKAHVRSADQIDAAWGEFESRTRLFQDLLSVLDRIYGRQEAGLLSLHSVLFGTFRTFVWEPQKTIIMEAALGRLDSCRELQDPSLYCKLRALWSMLEKLNVFSSNEVTNQIIDRTNKYYNAFFLSQSNDDKGLGDDGLVEKIIHKLNVELELVQSSFPESIQPNILACVRKCLIADRLQLFNEQLLNDSICSFNVDIVAKLYYLMSLIDELAQMAAAFSRHIKSAAINLISNQDYSIPKLLEYKDKVNVLTSFGLQNDAHFQSAVKEGIEAAMNQNTTKMSESLACHLNKLLTEPVVDVESLKDQIKKSMALFRYLQGKECFEGFYKQYLCTRLLSKSSCGMEFEHLAVAILKEECGAPFTSRMESMFRDMVNSRDTCAAFQKTPSYRNNRSHSFPFSVSIITSGIWPTPTETIDMFLPESIKQDMQLFETHYQKYAKKRTLKWEHAFSECTIRAPFKEGPVDIEMPGFVAAVFMQFDYTNQISLSKLKLDSKLPESWFNKAIQMLTHYQIIVAEDTQATLNLEAKLPERLYVREPVLSLAFPEDHVMEDVSLVRAQNKEEHNHRVDAAIVRFLKKNQRATLIQLQEQVSEVDTLKERLKVLMERDYCKHESSEDVYIYLP